ncbi:hypothetical protein RhiLY_06314 [Ceratobasidium sp. AG-Ba]|nr:hypothetical protein RhiLY_06314 [Ceratobasidium sp. AG-Ba]
MIENGRYSLYLPPCNGSSRFGRLYGLIEQRVEDAECSVGITLVCHPNGVPGRRKQRARIAHSRSYRACMRTLEPELWLHLNHTFLDHEEYAQGFAMGRGSSTTFNRDMVERMGLSLAPLRLPRMVCHILCVAVLAFSWTTGTVTPPSPISNKAAIGPRLAITFVFLLGLVYFYKVVRTLRKYADPLPRNWALHSPPPLTVSNERDSDDVPELDLERGEEFALGTVKDMADRAAAEEKT